MFADEGIEQNMGMEPGPQMQPHQQPTIPGFTPDGLLNQIQTFVPVVNAALPTVTTGIGEIRTEITNSKSKLQPYFLVNYNTLKTKSAIYCFLTTTETGAE